MDERVKRYIKMLVRDDLQCRKDDLALSKNSFDQGILSAEELKDYQDDVAFGELAMKQTEAL